MTTEIDSFLELIIEYTQARTRQTCWHHGLPRQIFASFLVFVALLGNVEHAQGATEVLHAAAVQRLHWSGLYLPDIEIVIGTDEVAVVSGTLKSDVVKAEVVETVQLTDGIRGVIDRLVLVP